jgi:hypothetical protein
LVISINERLRTGKTDTLKGDLTRMRRNWRAFFVRLHLRTEKRFSLFPESAKKEKHPAAPGETSRSNFGCCPSVAAGPLEGGSSGKKVFGRAGRPAVLDILVCHVFLDGNRPACFARPLPKSAQRARILFLKTL